MEDNSQENNIPNEPSGPRHDDDQEARETGHPHYHRHHHSHQPETPTYHAGKKKHRLEGIPRRTREIQSESFFAKNFLRITGIIFLLVAIWVSISSVGPLKDSLKSVVSKEFFQVNARHHITVSPGMGSATSQQIPSPAAGQPSRSNILIMAGAILLLFLLVLSLIFRKAEIRILTLVYWILFGAVWMVRYLLSDEKLLLWGFLGASSLVYFLFLILNIIKPLAGRKNKLTDYLIILLNSFFYYFFIFFLIYKAGLSSYEWVFTAGLIAINLVTDNIADRIQKDYPRNPYLIFILFLSCMLLPLITRSSMLVLFLAPLALLTMLYSKYTKTRYPVLISVTSLLLMILGYMAYWVFVYSSAAFMGNILDNRHIFIKGTWTSTVVLLTVYGVYKLLKHTEISLSKKFFDRANWLKFLKGTLLLIIYLSLFWIWYYLIYSLIRNDEVRVMIWFTFNCLYLVAAILYLGLTRSFFLRGTVIAGLVLNFAYPVLILYKVIGFRNNYLEGDPGSLSLFMYHYFCTGLLILVLFAQMRFIRKAFRGMKIIIRGFYVYFSLLMIFLALSEFEHGYLMLAIRKGVMIPESLFYIHRVPYSMILFFSSMIILFIGFIRKSRFLRLYSLIVLMVVLAKMLIYDIGSMSNTGKMILFFVFGMILLLISFFYSRIRHFFGRPSGRPKNVPPPPQSHSPL